MISLMLLQMESLKEALIFVKRENIRLKGEKMKVRTVCIFGRIKTGPG